MALKPLDRIPQSLSLRTQLVLITSMLIALSKNQFEYRAYSRLTRSWHVARPAIGTASYWAEAIAKVRYARNYAPRS